MDEANESKASSKDVAHITEAINQLLYFSGCPSKYRGYVDALVGISRGAIGIEISDEALAIHARGNDASSSTKDSLTKWTQRMRRNFDAWQRNLRLLFIDCESGGRDNAGYRKSRYKLPIVEHATTILNEAKKSAEWETDPQFQIGEAALNLVEKLKATPIDIPQKRSYAGLYKTEVRTPMKTAKAKLERALKYLEDKDTTLYAQDEQLVRDLEKLIERLKQLAEP